MFLFGDLRLFFTILIFAVNELMDDRNELFGVDMVKLESDLNEFLCCIRFFFRVFFFFFSYESIVYFEKIIWFLNVMVFYIFDIF